LQVQKQRDNIPLDTAASLKKGNFNTPSENSSKKDGGGLECDFKTAVRPLYSIGASKLCRPYNGFFYLPLAASAYRII